MDLYVQAFHAGGTHDLLYTDPAIINAFKNYLEHVILRCTNNPAVLELGNNLRYSSTFLASSNCNPVVINSFLNRSPKFVNNLRHSSSDRS